MQSLPECGRFPLLFSSTAWTDELSIACPGLTPGDVVFEKYLPLDSGGGSAGE